jgi:hypothetical protein
MVPASNRLKCQLLWSVFFRKVSYKFFFLEALLQRGKTTRRDV